MASVTKIYAQEEIRTNGKTFKEGEIIATIDSPITTQQLIQYLQTAKAADSQPVKREEAKKVEPAKPAEK